MRANFMPHIMAQFPGWDPATPIPTHRIRESDNVRVPMNARSRQLLENLLDTELDVTRSFEMLVEWQSEEEQGRASKRSAAGGSGGVAGACAGSSASKRPAGEGTTHGMACLLGIVPALDVRRFKQKESL